MMIMDAAFDDDDAPADAPAVKAAARAGARPGARPTRAGRPQTARHQRPPAREPERDEARPGASTDQRLYRTRRRTEDPFYIAKADIPSGMSYQWVRKACHGQPDTDNVINARENHWSPVPASRHPAMAPTGHDGAIEKKGMILMERPKYLTEEARLEDYEIAIEQVRRKERLTGETPAGQMTRDHPSVRNNSYVKKSYEPVEIPD